MIILAHNIHHGQERCVLVHQTIKNKGKDEKKLVLIGRDLRE